MSDDPKARIADAFTPLPDPEPGFDDADRFEPSTDDVEEGDAPSGSGLDNVDGSVVERCAGLDHSDTDNGLRLRLHFGRDLSVMAQEGTPGGDWLAWCGTHWDLAGGASGARMIAQRLGDRIGLEAAYLGHTPDETKAIRAGKAASRKAAEDRTDEDREAIERKSKAEKALDQRRSRRRAFGVTSKNKGRFEAALECAAPHLRRAPDRFNPARLTFATLTHTLRFSRRLDEEANDALDPEAYAAAPRVYRVSLHAAPGHERDDWITAVVPTAYDPDAVAPRWEAFLAEMLPDADKRRTVQQFAGVGLLAIPVQRVMFHYGLGANGKSVFLEVLCRLLGPGLAVGLPRESLVGGSERAAGAASPDIVRLYGKRLVRVTELKADVPVQEDLIKRLTGGEAIPARTLFKGFFEFQNFATPHMSGNGFPTIDGTDNGIWRRMLVVHWDQTLPEERQRDFEEFVSEFVTEEGPGILNWLIAGARDFLLNGLSVATSIRDATGEYREEMDPIGEFVTACVVQAQGYKVQANDMYQAYMSWSLANAKRVRSQTKFGRTLKQRFEKSSINGCVYYMNCDLQNVPARPVSARNPED
ncbi:DNA primase family protein [Methylobacterium oryzihabitans]|uniref:DNA primase n=1 Tax=Methylobacterium oryzihabitans TaxID=2499852 RepID=A0A3S2YJQ7_9HYPH|nr:DNA primase family protein [Methylobacterium oryzihabitans]RVU13149.1 DNA primase [Methylobacterium oryzihabitans]